MAILGPPQREDGYESQSEFAQRGFRAADDDELDPCSDPTEPFIRQIG